MEGKVLDVNRTKSTIELCEGAMYLFFDTETTGLNRNKDHLVQIAWALANDNGDVHEEECHVIRPDGFIIPSASANIHGIATAEAMRIGKPLENILARFASAASKATVIVAHNLSFDFAILQHEFSVAGLSFPLHRKVQVCTMKLSTTWCRLPKLNGSSGFKYPRLDELYYRLFGEGFDSAHDALADTRACMRCYYELVSKEIITPPIISSSTLFSKIAHTAVVREQNILHFPNDKSRGVIKFYSHALDEIFQKKEARGVVSVPSGQYICLTIDQEVKDFSFLKHCDPNFMLNELDFSSSKVEDNHLLFISKLHSLRKINFRTASISGAGFLYLRGIPNLEYIDLMGCKKLTDDSMRHIGAIFAIKTINLGGASITDKGIAYLGSLNRLEELYLWSTNITDSCLQKLKGLVSLKHLSLHRTEISDKGIAALESLQNLESLSLDRTGISTEKKAFLVREFGWEIS